MKGVPKRQNLRHKKIEFLTFFDWSILTSTFQILSLPEPNLLGVNISIWRIESAVSRKFRNPLESSGYLASDRLKKDIWFDSSITQPFVFAFPIEVVTMSESVVVFHLIGCEVCPVLPVSALYIWYGSILYVNCWVRHTRHHATC